MVFCKLSKTVTKKLKDAEQAIEGSTLRAKETINAHISQHLATVDQKKITLSAKIQQKIAKQKQVIHDTIIQPHEEQKRKNMAMMYFVDACLAIVLGLFVYKMYPLIKHFVGREAFTAEQFNEAKKLPESAFPMANVRLAQEYRKSFQDWRDYYNKEDAYSEYNVGTTEIRRGTDLREPMRFMIQYVIPYVILAYIVWFLVKYIKYVIAAIWGFFVMVYQFVTKKITCKMAEKWYIRLGTGWSRCNPQFNQYVDDWQRNYITRPIAQERITYLKGVQTVTTHYKAKYGEQPHWRLWNKFWDWLHDFKRIYVDLPLQELYLWIIDFHPTYVVRPYEVLSNRENPYDSKTKSGKVCKCPPRKTVYRKMKNYLETHPEQRLAAAAQHIANKVHTTHAKIQKSVSMGKNSKNSKKRSNKKSFFSRVCSDEDSNTKNKKTNKTLPQALWSILMLATVCLVVYGLLLVPQEIQLLAWLGRNKYMAWAATAIYLTCLVGGGIYSFLI